MKKNIFKLKYYFTTLNKSNLQILEQAAEQLQEKSDLQYYQIKREFTSNTYFLNKKFQDDQSYYFDEHQIRRTNTLINGIENFTHSEQKYFELCIKFYKDLFTLQDIPEEEKFYKISLIGKIKRKFSQHFLRPLIKTNKLLKKQTFFTS